MTIEIPPELEWVSYLAGSEWPQGDEDAMFRIGGHWRNSADDLAKLIPDLNRVRQETIASLSGETATAADEQFKKLFDGDFSVDKLVDAMAAVGDLAWDQGTQIEYTKLQVLSTLAIVAAEIAWAIYNSWETLGASLAWIPTFEGFGIAVIRQIANEFLKRIRVAITEAATKAFAVKALKMAGTGALHGVGIGLGQELAIQLYQDSEGHRHGINWGQVGKVALGGAVGGAAGALAHGPRRPLSVPRTALSARRSRAPSSHLGPVSRAVWEVRWPRGAASTASRSSAVPPAVRARVRCTGRRATGVKFTRPEVGQTVAQSRSRRQKSTCPISISSQTALARIPISPNHLRRTQTSIVRPRRPQRPGLRMEARTPQSRQAQARALNRMARARMALGRTVVRGNRRTVRRPGRATGRGRVAQARMAPRRTTVRRAGRATGRGRVGQPEWRWAEQRCVHRAEQWCGTAEHRCVGRAEQRVGAEWRQPEWRWAEQRCVHRAEQWCGTAEHRCVGRAEQRVGAEWRQPEWCRAEQRCVHRAEQWCGTAEHRCVGRAEQRVGAEWRQSEWCRAEQRCVHRAEQWCGTAEQRCVGRAEQRVGAEWRQSEWCRAEQRRSNCTEWWRGSTEQRFLDRTAVSPGRRRIASAGSAAECGWDGRSRSWCRGNTAFRHTAHRHSPCVCWLPELRERIYGWSQRGQSGS